MTRPTVFNANRPGVAGEVFPEQVQEIARRFGLTGEATILRFSSGQDAGGAPDDDWTADAFTVHAQLQPLRNRSTGQPVASQINESSTHIVSFHPAAGVNSSDRFLMDGTTWIITGTMHRDSGADLVHRFECREKP